jgi:hypothetical protein
MIAQVLSSLARPADTHSRDSPNRAVRPLRVGAGLDDLVRQEAGFAAANARLAGDLRRLATSDGERGKLRPLFDNLAAGNEVLADALRLESAGKIGRAFRRLEDFTRIDAAERRITRRLGLGDCGS